MCGRYTLRELAMLRAVLGFETMADFDRYSEDRLAGMYNIPPSVLCPVVRMDKDDKPALGLAKWGLIPSWTKGKPNIQPINAKSETVATSPMFRQALERRRCLVPADGFYEWKGAKPPKTPYFIHMKDDCLFAFAGLWERWKPDEQSEPVDTFTILTTTPNELMSNLHSRMPVIVAKTDYGRWLDRNNKASDVLDLLKPFTSEQMEAWPVSTTVNSPKNQGAELIEKA